MEKFLVFWLKVLDRFLKNRKSPEPPVSPPAPEPAPEPAPKPEPPVSPPEPPVSPPEPPVSPPEPPVSPPEPPPVSPAIPNSEKAWFQNLLSEHNSERLVSGLDSLEISATLCLAAQKHADWMAANKNMSHTGAGGSNVAKRVSQEGYEWALVGENIAWGQGSSHQVMQDWMHSSGHRANILNSHYREIGLGLTNSPNGPYWAVVFGTPKTWLTKLYKRRSCSPGGVVASSCSSSGVSK